MTAATAVGALLFAALSLNATRDQIAVAEQGQITERYSRAIEQLGQRGPDRIQTRLGAIYALERLAHDSPRDQPTIIEVLASFIRTSVDRTEFKPSERLDPILRCQTDVLETPPADVQAALTVLGRRDVAHDSTATIDLSQSCLVRADLTGADLRGAKLSFTELSHARLSHANLTSAKLILAGLNGTDLVSANLSGADLSGAQGAQASLIGANLQGADLGHADFGDAYFRGANLRGANLPGTNLTGAYLYGADLHGVQRDEPTGY